MAETNKNWIKMNLADLEKLVIQLHKEGNSPAKIGLILRDKHGVPKAKLIGKKITKILQENNLDYENDEAIVKKDIDNLKKHIEKNIHDYSAKRSLTKKLWVVKN